jgi:hypothetical protein
MFMDDSDGCSRFGHGTKRMHEARSFARIWVNDPLTQNVIGQRS